MDSIDEIGRRSPMLCNGSLSGLTVPVPAYDRSNLRVGIVHIGVGGFHRAHQAVYLDRLMNKGHAFDGGIGGMGVLPSDGAMRDAMASQDYLYTLVVKNPDGSTEARVIGSIIDFLHAPDDQGCAQVMPSWLQSLGVRRRSV